MSGGGDFDHSFVPDITSRSEWRTAFCAKCGKTASYHPLPMPSARGRLRGIVIVMTAVWAWGFVCGFLLGKW